MSSIWIASCPFVCHFGFLGNPFSRSVLLASFLHVVVTPSEYFGYISPESVVTIGRFEQSKMLIIPADLPIPDR